jgi:hypothetical protein
MLMQHRFFATPQAELEVVEINCRLLLADCKAAKEKGDADFIVWKAMHSEDVAANENKMKALKAKIAALPQTLDGRLAAIKAEIAWFKGIILEDDEARASSTSTVARTPSARRRDIQANYPRLFVLHKQKKILEAKVEEERSCSAAHRDGLAAAASAEREGFEEAAAASAEREAELLKSVHQKDQETAAFKANVRRIAKRAGRARAETAERAAKRRKQRNVPLSSKLSSLRRSGK